MLILQRKAGESLVIGDDITVRVISVDGTRVRLAIDAPEDIPILRSELITARAANRDSAREEAAPTELWTCWAACWTRNGRGRPPGQPLPRPILRCRRRERRTDL